MRGVFKFKSTLGTDLYLHIPAGGYRMVKAGAEFIVEGNWDRYWEELITKGQIVLLDVLEPIHSFIKKKPGKYRSIDDPGTYND